MARATISRKILDTLIRAKMSAVSPCKGVTAMPVTHHPDGEHCNWKIPGWTGDGDAVKKCREQIRDYVALLQSQFDIEEKRQS